MSVIFSATMKRFAGEAFFVALGQIIGTLGALVGVRLLTGLLDPAEYGQLNLAMSATILVAFVFGDFLMNTAMRFYAPLKEKHELHIYFASLRYILGRFILGFTLFGLILIFALRLAGYEVLYQYAIPGVALSILLAINSAFDGVQNGARNRFIVALNYVLLQWLRFSLACILVISISSQGDMALWGYVFASCLVVAIQCLFFVRHFREDLSLQGSQDEHHKALRDMIGFGWPFIVIGLFSWVLSFADRWAVSFFCDARQVGFYVALVQIGYFPVLFGTKVLIQLISPLFYEHAGDAKGRDKIKQVGSANKYVVIIVFMLIAVAFVGLHFWHESIFSIFVDQQYRFVSYLLPWTVLAAGVFACGQVLLVSVYSDFATRQVIPVMIVTAVIGVPAYCVGAFFQGIDGVVFGMNIVSIIYFVAAYIVHSRTVNADL